MQAPRLGILPADTKFVFFSFFARVRDLTREIGTEYMAFVDTHFPEDHRKRAWTLVDFCTQKRNIKLHILV